MNPTSRPSHGHLGGCIRVIARAGQLAVVAVAPVPTGTGILRFEGQVVSRASRYSVQVGVDEHIDLLGELDQGDLARRSAWRYLNHSCDPSAAPRGLVLVALREQTR